MPCIYHKSHHKSLKRVKRPKQHVDHHKFYGACKYCQTHDHRVPKTEPRHIHINTIRQPHKPKPCKNRDGIGKCRAECTENSLCLSFHFLFLPSYLLSLSFMLSASFRLNPRSVFHFIKICDK